jgi:flavin-dependent dehydrogenase
MADVIIIGGGPAGSVLGRYLSMAGIENTIAERANHPRARLPGVSIPLGPFRVAERVGLQGRAIRNV